MNIPVKTHVKTNKLTSNRLNNIKYLRKEGWVSVLGHSCLNSRKDARTILDLAESYGDRCRNLFGLLDLLLAIPAASAEAERGFSIMKKTKTDWRSSLQDDHMSDLMIIQLESKNIGDFDPTESIELWLTSGQAPRRPCFERPSKDIPPGPAISDDEINPECDAWAELNKTD